MRLFRRVMLLCLALCLAACASHHIKPDQLQKLHKGMTHAQVAQLFSNPPLEHFTLVVRRQHVHIQVYKERQMAYFLAYQNDRLMFWGYPSDFTTSSDALIRAVGRRAAADWEAMRQDG